MSNEQLAMSNEKKLYEGCRVSGFELRSMREESIKLQLAICGECPPRKYPNSDKSRTQNAQAERFDGDFVTYKINGQEYKNIYGVTLSTKKENGSKTKLLIKRALEQGGDLPEVIENITITSNLLRDKYEFKQFGTFRITLFNLFLLSDETDINAADAVIGPLQYYVAGSVFTDVYTSGNKELA
jgi:hypothetical protein